jgi:hypothetical protein
MAGSIAEAIAQIMSVQPAALATLAAAVRDAGSKSLSGGQTLSSSAKEVGAQQGDPYAAYRDRLAPVAEWMIRFEPPATDMAAKLQNASTVATDAQKQAAQLNHDLAAMTVPNLLPTSVGDPVADLRAKYSNVKSPSEIAAAQASTLEQLNKLIDQMTASFEAVQPPDPGTAPVRNGAGSTAQAATFRSGAAEPGAQTGAGGASGAEGAGTGGVDPAVAAAVGPTSGPMAGWVRDPNTGNLVDPATGREVNPAGQFLDPITGRPFGTAADQNVSRLEGLQGGLGATGGLFGTTGAGAFTVPTGGVGAITGSAGGGGFAGLYGGMIPPSLMGANPAMGELSAKAKRNLQTKAAVAQRYSALMTGQEQQTHPYMPPMGGVGGGMGGVARSGRASRRLVSEPSELWGATGRGNRDGRTRSSGDTTELVEDTDVWTGGEQAGSGLLDR